MTPEQAEARRVAIERYQQIKQSRDGMSDQEAKVIYMQKYGAGEKRDRSGYGKGADDGKKSEKFSKDKAYNKRGG